MRTRDEAIVETLDTDSIVSIVDNLPVTVVLLYGSHARGDATESSDIDLAVDFDASLTSGERTQTRMALIEQVSTAVQTDAVDVLPLARAPATLVADVLADGILLYGSAADLAAYESARQPPDQLTHGDRLDEFDALLTDLEQVV